MTSKDHQRLPRAHGVRRWTRPGSPGPNTPTPRFMVRVRQCKNAQSGTYALGAAGARACLRPISTASSIGRMRPTSENVIAGPM